MTRFVPAAVLGVALFAAPAAAQPSTLPLGKSVRVEFTEKMRYDTVWGRPMYFVYPIEQGDRFKVEMTAVGGVELGMMALVERSVGNNAFEEVQRATGNGTLTLTQTKGLPGRTCRIMVTVYGVGTVNVRVVKLRDDGTEVPAAGVPAAPGGPATPAAGGVDERLRRLEAENAEIRRQLAEILRRLERKN